MTSSQLYALCPALPTAYMATMRTLFPTELDTPRDNSIRIAAMCVLCAIRDVIASVWLRRSNEVSIRNVQDVCLDYVGLLNSVCDIHADVEINVDVTDEISTQQSNRRGT